MARGILGLLFAAALAGCGDGRGENCPGGNCSVAGRTPCQRDPSRLPVERIDTKDQDVGRCDCHSQVPPHLTSSDAGFAGQHRLVWTK